MRAIFFGSPEFAVPSLEVLHEIAEVVAVLCQPDRPAGRGLSPRAPAVKERALQLGLQVWQPRKVRTPEFAHKLASLNADVGVVAAYGRILPKAVLCAPRLGCVNVHASVLPRWRGAAPIQWAIAHGDQETGVTLMQMDEGMDTGPILAVEVTAIAQNESAGALGQRLAKLGAALLREQLPRYLAGALTPRPQNEADATMAPLLKKEDGQIRWDTPASQVHDHVRAMNPWPGAFSDLEGRRLKIHRAHALTLDRGSAPPGQVIALDGDCVLVACGTGVLAIDELQEAGRKRVGARAFIAGRGIVVGDRFSS